MSARKKSPAQKKVSSIVSNLRKPGTFDPVTGVFTPQSPDSKLSRKQYHFGADTSFGPLNHDDALAFTDERKSPSGAWALSVQHADVTMLFTEKQLRKLYLWLDKTFSK